MQIIKVSPCTYIRVASIGGSTNSTFNQLFNVQLFSPISLSSYAEAFPSWIVLQSLKY